MAYDLTRYESQVEHYFGAQLDSAFETVGCPLCRPNTESIQLFSKGTLRIHRCRCGFVWNARQPTQETLDSFYRDSLAMTSWSELKDGEFERARQKKKFGPAAAFLSGRAVGSVLDVGCGNGAFLSLVKELIPAADVLGTDLSPPAIAACRRRGIPCEQWDIDQTLNQNQDTYDVISLWGVLEHVKDPVGVMRSVSSRLNPGGYAIVCVPNMRSLVVATLREKCFTFCPQHLWYFDSLTLDQVFHLAGLETVKMTTIEPERLPCAKMLSGLDPYASAPEWAYDLTFSACPSEDEILESGLGYKIVAIAQGSPSLRIAS